MPHHRERAPRRLSCQQPDALDQKWHGPLRLTTHRPVTQPRPAQGELQSVLHVPAWRDWEYSGCSIKHHQPDTHSILLSPNLNSCIRSQLSQYSRRRDRHVQGRTERSREDGRRGRGKDRAHITQRLVNHGNNLVLYLTSTAETFQCFMQKWGVWCELLGNRSLCHPKTDVEGRSQVELGGSCYCLGKRQQCLTKMLGKRRQREVAGFNLIG